MIAETLPFEASEIEQSIVARWRRVVARLPDQTAVKTADGDRHTYAELDRDSNRVAHALLDVLGPGNHPVLLCLDHSYPLLVSILGTIKAGKAYAAADTRQPLGQLDLLYATTGAPAIVTDHRHAALAQALAHALAGRPTAAGVERPAVLCIENVPESGLGCPDVEIGPDIVAGLFFTSGTIKQPRGVARSHRIILHRSWFGAGGSGFAPGEAISGIRQCGLGGGMADVFNALLYGAAYCLYDLHRDGLQGLSEWLQRQQITYFHPPIVLFRQWLDTLATGDFFPHLRHVLPSGRKTRADLERLWPHVGEECVVLTSYSATETTQITSVPITRRTLLAEGVLHVGAPLPGKTVTVIAADGQPAPAGEVGEVVVRSRYIATGYWRQPELTAQRFAPSSDGSGETIFRTGDSGRLRDDGFLDLVGRQDSQVKISGYRVVLHEVEDALRALPSVQEALVTADEERGRLHAYLIAAAEPPTPPAEIRSALAARFPHYALPTHISYLPAFPLLPSGKVDRRRLPAPPQSRPAHLPPRTPPRTAIEEALAALWAELLQLDEAGVDDSFFDLGGHSLLAMRMFTEIQRRFGRRVPMLAFAETPTIARLAPHLETGARGGDDDRNSHEGVLVVEGEEFALRVASARATRRRSGGRRLESASLPMVALGARMLAWCYRHPWAYRRHYADEVRLIERFYDALSEPGLPLEEVIRQSLMAQRWTSFVGARLPSITSQAQMDRLFAVRGLSNVEEAVGRGRGVILARSHTLGRREGLRALARHGFDEILSIGLGRASRRLRKKVDESCLMAVRSHLLFQSQQALLQGRIVSILPDGFHGNHEGVRFGFHGRQRTFRTGFAELALDTDASIVPVFVSIDPAGRFLVEFPPALTVDRTARREEQLASLVTQYVELLRTHWAVHPAAVPWWQMRKHLALRA